MKNFNLKKYISEGKLYETQDYTGGVSFDDEIKNDVTTITDLLKDQTVIITDISDGLGSYYYHGGGSEREVKIDRVELKESGYHELDFDDGSNAILFYTEEWENFLEGDEVVLHPDEVIMKLKHAINYNITEDYNDSEEENYGEWKSAGDKAELLNNMDDLANIRDFKLLRDLIQIQGGDWLQEGFYKYQIKIMMNFLVDKI